jgi:multicomponent Na+:H+ antiporter subunit D
MVVAVIVLAVSTILNALYFIRAVISIYTPRNEHYRDASFRPGKSFCVGMVCFIVINFILGLASFPIINAIEQGLKMFS